MLTTVMHIFDVNIFNIFITCMWLNAIYIIHDFFIAPHCNVTMTLVQLRVISNDPLFGFSSFKTE